jgi:hypothetical protein
MKRRIPISMATTMMMGKGICIFRNRSNNMIKGNAAASSSKNTITLSQSVVARQIARFDPIAIRSTKQAMVGGSRLNTTRRFGAREEAGKVISAIKS